MGDKARKVLKVVGIAALGFATFGIGTLIAAGTTIGSALGATAFLGLSLGNIALIGLGALSAGSAKSVDDTGANQRGTPHADAGSLSSYVFGRTLVHMPLLVEEQTGASPDRVVHNVYVHAWHRISAYISLTVASDAGPEVVSFSGNAATGAYANVLWWFRANGSQTTALNASPFSNSSWPSTAVAKGMAHSAISWNVDDSAFAAKFSGMPGRIEIVVDGALLYDPRLDSSAGGTGAHRFDEPSTWGFNNGNAVLVLLRFMIGEYSDDGSLIWGRGIEENEYDQDNFIAMANVCDELRDGIPSYRLAGAHLLDGSWAGFVAQWEEETGGRVSKQGGVYRVWLPHDDLTALTTITEDDLLAGQSIEHAVASSGINSLYNTARGRYIDPDQGYKAFPYPEVSEASAVTEDGGRKRVLNHDFSWVQDVEIAQRTMRLRIRRSRFQRVWTVPIGWMGHGPNYRPFTVHYLNCAETDFENQLVRVIDRRLSMNGACLLVVQQEDESLYNDTIPLLDPHANNSIPTRIDRSSTVTPRYIDDGTIIRRSVTYLEEDVGPTNFVGSALDFVVFVELDIEDGDEVVISGSGRVSQNTTNATSTSLASYIGAVFASQQGFSKSTTAQEVFSLNAVFTGMAAGTHQFGILAFASSGVTSTYTDVAMTVIHRKG